MNLDLLFLHLPRPIATFPFFLPDGLGLSIFLTSPGLLFAVRADWRARRAWLLLGATIAVLIPTLLYYGGGWLQFGYRYFLDSVPFVIALCGLAAVHRGTRRDGLACVDRVRGRRQRRWRLLGVQPSMSDTTRSSTGSTIAVLAIFVLSGAAGLIYEIVWSRQLVLVFGNTTQAVSAILTGFFGGMAIGAAVGGRIADRVRSPLRMYGILELVLVVVVLVTPISFRLIHEVYRGIYPSLESTPQLLALVRLVLAVAALAPATILMGATFPSLTRYLARTSALSRAFGRLYAANTLGAIVGTLAAGLVLIELFGLGGALAIGAGCSAIAGIGALWLARGDGRDPAPATVTAASPAPPRVPAASPAPPRVPAGTASRVGLALVIAFVSGLTSLAYQVTWTRLLASGTGNTTYVFTVILAIFLAGIAIGAMIFNLARPHLRDPVRLLAITQIVVAALALIGLLGVLGRPETLDPGKPIETLRALFGSAVLVVLPVTIVLGIAFPTAAALLRDQASEAGAESGSLLAVQHERGHPRQPARAVHPDADRRFAVGHRGPRGDQCIPRHRPGTDRASAPSRDGRRRGRRAGDRRPPRPPAQHRRPAERGVHPRSRRPDLRLDRGRDRVRPGGPDPRDTRVVGGGHVDDPADRRCQAHADPAAHRPAGLGAGPGRRVRDGYGVPLGAHRGAADRCRRAGAVRAGHVRLLLPGRGHGAGRPGRTGRHRRRAESPRAHRPNGSTSS